MKLKTWALALCLMLPFAGEAGINDMIQNYNPGGKLSFSADRGKELWFKKNISSEDGKERDCTTCHGKDLTRPGKHAKSGKVIDPMALSVNKDRFTDPKKIEKWLTRNCKWTYGRECTNQEKGDLLTYLSTL